MKKPKVVSLFSGCGGLDLGFQYSGYDIIWANDILKDACDTYRFNIGDLISPAATSPRYSAAVP